MKTEFFYAGSNPTESKRNEKEGYLHVERGDIVTMYGVSYVVTHTDLNLDQEKYEVFLEETKDSSIAKLYMK